MQSNVNLLSCEVCPHLREQVRKVLFSGRIYPNHIAVVTWEDVARTLTIGRF